jgi:hypothetical protein
VEAPVEYAEIESDRSQHENVKPDPKKGSPHGGFA